MPWPVRFWLECRQCLGPARTAWMMPLCAYAQQPLLIVLLLVDHRCRAYVRAGAKGLEHVGFAGFASHNKSVHDQPFADLLAVVNVIDIQTRAVAKRA